MDRLELGRMLNINPAFLGNRTLEAVTDPYPGQIVVVDLFLVEHEGRWTFGYFDSDADGYAKPWRPPRPQPRRRSSWT